MIPWDLFARLSWKLRRFCRLWKLNLGLEDLIPENLQSLWNEWKCKLAVLSQVQVPQRHLIDSTVMTYPFTCFLMLEKMATACARTSDLSMLAELSDVLFLLEGRGVHQ